MILECNIPQVLRRNKLKLRNWFKRTEYSYPGFNWFYHDKVGVFAWNAALKVGFTFNPEPSKDKNLWLYSEYDAQKLLTD